VLVAVVGLVTWLAVAAIGAPAANAADPVLYDQSGTAVDGPVTVDWPDNSFDTEGAADFVVPSGQTWNLSSIIVQAYDFNDISTEVNSINVRIYADSAGAPGALVTSQTDSSTGFGNPAAETITLNPVISLPSGTYWLSLQGITSNGWYWGTNTNTVGALGMWRNPGGGWSGSSCNSFVPTTSCPIFSGNGANVNDYVFQLLGTTGAGSGLCNGLTPTITGSGTIKGTSGADVILGSSGPDDISGGGGADTICAGDGDDVVHGGGGGDRIEGGAGKDQIYGQAGNDVISGGGDNDTLKGQDGSDQIAGGQGNDKLAGGYGDDFLSGGDGNDHIFGNDGTDSTNGSAGNDTMFGGAGADDLHGNAGEDALDGGTGTDSCSGGGGTDTLNACES
jgi:Ca2+-binding RTX toxin-like protein